MAAYATRAQFEAYVEGWATDDTAALDRLLRRASEDIDEYLGDYVLEEEGDYAGLKLDPTELTYAEARALERATCAQAEYRFEMGEEFFVRPQFRSTSGPEFSTDGKPPIVAPKARRELAGSGLVRNSISLGARRREPSWLGFSHNVGDRDFDYGD